MAKKQKRLVVQTPDLVNDGDDELMDPKTGLEYFCLSTLRTYFEIPKAAKEFHVEASRSPWFSNSVRFLVAGPTEFRSFPRVQGHKMYWSNLGRYVAQLRIGYNETGYIHIRVLYTE